MKNILITGSSKRIGAEFVKFFYKNNFNIALHYNKSKKQAIKLSKLLGYKKNRVVIVKGDLSSEKGTKKIFSESKKKLGKITHLINCASVFENDDIKNFNSSKWNMNINAAYDFLILSLLCLTKLDQPEYFEPSMIFFEL